MKIFGFRLGSRPWSWLGLVGWGLPWGETFVLLARLSFKTPLFLGVGGPKKNNLQEGKHPQPPARVNDFETLRSGD